MEEMGRGAAVRGAESCNFSLCDGAEAPGDARLDPVGSTDDIDLAQSEMIRRDIIDVPVLIFLCSGMPVYTCTERFEAGTDIHVVTFSEKTGTKAGHFDFPVFAVFENEHIAAPVSDVSPCVIQVDGYFSE